PLAHSLKGPSKNPTRPWQAISLSNFNQRKHAALKQNPIVAVPFRLECCPYFSFSKGRTSQLEPTTTDCGRRASIGRSVQKCTSAQLYFSIDTQFSKHTITANIYHSINL